VWEGVAVTVPPAGVQVRTQVKMEKKEKTMVALAASAPSFRGLSSDLENCH